MELSNFFELLKEEGIDEKDCEIIKESTWDRVHIRDVLLLYKGVKHNIRLGRSEISIKSYLKSDEAYWESQGNFMFDTSADIREKWRKEHD